MKNLIRAGAIGAAMAVAPGALLAQENQFEVGTKALSIGLLLGSAGTSYGTGSGALGLGVGFEVGIKDIAGQVRLGVGGFLGYQGDDAPNVASAYSVSNIMVHGFLNGHYQLKAVPKLDLYAGPVLGIVRQSRDFSDDYFGDYCELVSNSDCKDSSTDPAFGVQAGARYQLTSSLLGMAQAGAGAGLPWLNVGIAFKF